MIEIDKEVIFQKAFSDQDVAGFANISEDNNPIHLDEDIAAKSIFKKRVVHGVLLVSMFSKIFGTIYPGTGTIYLSQTSKFLKPAFLGDLITAKVTLTNYEESKNRGVFLTECFNEAEQLILTGEAKILFPKDFQIKQ